VRVERRALFWERNFVPTLDSLADSRVLPEGSERSLVRRRVRLVVAKNKRRPIIDKVGRVPVLGADPKLKVVAQPVKNALHPERKIVEYELPVPFYLGGRKW
jgi:hypothetical protein